MEDTVFSKLSKLDWFDCEADIHDFISDIASGLKSKDFNKVIEEANFWIEDVYGGCRKNGKVISKSEVETALKEIFEEV